MDKAFWQAIRDNNFELPITTNLDELTSELLGYLGSIDPDLRDRYAYFILASWIERGNFSAAQMSSMAERMIQHLSAGLGEQETDSVFLRSFAALILAELLSYDLSHPYLDPERFDHYVAAAHSWYKEERDLRGYDSARGWAHAGAHGADLLRVIAMHPRTDVEGLSRILDLVTAKVTGLHGQVFICDEDERLVATVLAAFDRNLLTQQESLPFIARLAEKMSWSRGELTSPEIVARHNTRNLLRALYLQLLQNQPSPAELLDAVRISLEQR